MMRKHCGAVFSLVAFSLLLVSSTGYGATITNSYPANAPIPIGGSGLYYVGISGVPANAVITNVEAKFDYIAYGVVQNYVSCRFNRGSDPGTSGGAVLVSQGSLPAGNPGTYGYVSFTSWNGQGVNTGYYFRFFDSGSPYGYTVKTIYVRITYELPPPSPTLISPGDYSVTFNQTPHNFDWNSVSGADRYRIYVDNNSGFGSPEINSEPTASSLTSYTGLSNNVYYWKVQARNSVGQWGNWSTTKRFVVDTPPPKPTLGSPANGSQYDQGTSVTFSWSGPTGNSINRYYLRIVAGTNLNAQPIFDQELSSTSRSITLTGWAQGTYTWAVRAIKNAPSGFNQLTYEGAIGWGPYATRTLTVTPPAPTLGSPLNGVDLLGPPYVFTWSAVAGAGAYHIKIATEPTFASPVHTDNGISGAATSYSYGGSLAWGTTHYWQMQTLNTSGTAWGSWSAVQSFVPQSPTLPAPNLVSPLTGDTLAPLPNGKITLQWTAVSGAAGYRLFIDTLSGMDMGSGQTMFSATLNEGAHKWKACTLSASLQCGPMSSEENFNVQTAPYGFLARTVDDPDVYWIMYGKKWKIIDQTTFFGLGYTDGEIQWYESGALSALPSGNNILASDQGFCYRNQGDSTVYLVEDGQSHPFFNWESFTSQGFSAEDIYWATPTGAAWIQIVYPRADVPMIRVEPQTINIQ